MGSFVLNISLKDNWMKKNNSVYNSMQKHHTSHQGNLLSARSWTLRKSEKYEACLLCSHTGLQSYCHCHRWGVQIWNGMCMFMAMQSWACEARNFTAMFSKARTPRKRMKKKKITTDVKKAIQYPAGRHAVGDGHDILQWIKQIHFSLK